MNPGFSFFSVQPSSLKSENIAGGEKVACVSTNENIKDEDQALDFLEQWLSAPAPETPKPVIEAPRSLDPGLRAIERLVTQHKELFRRHAPSQNYPTS